MIIHWEDANWGLSFNGSKYPSSIINRKKTESIHHCLRWENLKMEKCRSFKHLSEGRGKAFNCKMEVRMKGKGRGTTVSSHRPWRCPVWVRSREEFNKGCILTNEYKAETWIKVYKGICEEIIIMVSQGSYAASWSLWELHERMYEGVLRTLGYKCWKEVGHFHFCCKGSENEGQCLVKM